MKLKERKDGIPLRDQLQGVVQLCFGALKRLRGSSDGASRGYGFV